MELDVENEWRETIHRGTDISNFKTQLEEKIAELSLTPDQVFNADETGLNW